MSRHLDGSPKSCDLCGAEATPHNPVRVDPKTQIAFCEEWSDCGKRIDSQTPKKAPALLVGARVRITEPDPFYGMTGVVAAPPNPKHPTWRLVELPRLPCGKERTAVCPVESLEPATDTGDSHVH